MGSGRWYRYRWCVYRDSLINYYYARATRATVQEKSRGKSEGFVVVALVVVVVGVVVVVWGVYGGGW